MGSEMKTEKTAALAPKANAKPFGLNPKSL